MKNPRGEPGRGHALLEIVGAFLRLGLVAFGGPAAHIALMEGEFVGRRKWLTREEFLDRLAAVSLLPGPSSTELAIYIGHLRGGWPGLLAAGTAFIVPAAVTTAALAWAYVRFGAVPQIAGVLFGVKPVVVVLLAQALWVLGRTALKSVELAVLAAVVAGLSLAHVSPVALLAGTGVAWMVAVRREKREPSGGSLAVVPGAAAATAVGSTSLFLYFLKVGAVLFGSGYVLLAVLRSDLVERLHWLSETQLLDAIAVSQATPGPFFTVATFVGYLLGGGRGAALATLGMFLPAFFLVAATARVLPALRKSPAAGAFLDGANAAALALMAVVGWQFARGTLVSPGALGIAAAAALLAFRYRVNSAWLVAGAAVLGLLLGIFGKV